MIETHALTPAESRCIGYKLLFSVCEDALAVASKIDGVAVSPDVAECEDAAAKARWDLTEALHPEIQAGATWMAEVVADDVTTSDDDQELIEDIKDQYAADFATFGVAMLGVLIEQGRIAIL
jgi:hypothetical protein